VSTRSFEGKTAVVTGASRGIGRAVVEELAARGACVFAGFRTLSPDAIDACAAIAQLTGSKVVPVHADLTTAETANECARVIAGLGEIHVLVNNAGVASGSPFQMTTLNEFREVFEVNFFATAAFTQLLSRRISRSGGGSIVNIGSTAGLNGDSGTSAYGSSKAALMFLTTVMARELGHSGIRVNAVAPTVTSTDMYVQMNQSSRDALISSGAIQRAATPLEVAKVVCFLAGEESTMITGQILRVDGGQRGR
jgi:3-oxoacyl-[acyl-carrier protein] reductase